MKDTMRSMEPTVDKSTKNSFAITTASRLKPANHMGLSRRRVASSIAVIASTAQNIDRLV